MIIKQDGSVWSTGVQPDSKAKGFVQIFSVGVKAAAAGNSFSMVLNDVGMVMITGKNNKGQLCFFDGSPISRRTFFIVKNIPVAKAVIAGGYHSMVLTHGGRLWAAGWNKYGQLGDGSTSDTTKFIPVKSSGAEVVTAAAGDAHSIILKQDGSIWATGRNDNGQLGDGSQADRSNFVKVISAGVVNVAASGYHSLLLMQNRSVWATGWNEYGQLGDGSIVDRTNYVQVVMNGGKAVAAGSRHSIVLKQNGSVWATGYNQYGQLGDGSTVSRKVFVQVISGGVKLIAAGAFHSMVLKKDSSVWAAGSNKDGQFGDGCTPEKTCMSYVRLEAFEKGKEHRVILCTPFASDHMHTIRF